MKIEEIPPIENVEIEVKIAYGKINQLVDLVNSQQEAIGELQTEIGVLRNMVLQSQEAIEKLQEHVDHEARHVSEPADDKPELVSKARYAEKLGIHNNPHEHVYRCQDCEKTQAEVQDSDTHRTVTLRIPKGMGLGEALIQAYEWELEDSGLDKDKALDFRGWCFLALDSTLQKALDEVEE